MKRGAATIVALTAVLVVPASASAHRYTAYTGSPTKTPSSAPPTTQLNRFFPAKLKVRAGDSVRYLNASGLPHTASILAKGTPVPPVAIPGSTGATYSGINDPNGNPFFFNGRPKWIYNPAVWIRQGGRTVDDRQTHGSGAIFPGEQPGSYRFKFARRGTYKVLCLIHPGMQQTVKVLKRRARGADSDAKVNRAVARQVRRGFKDAGKAAQETAAPNTVLVGAERRNATLLTYLPNSLEVAAGTTVTFVNASPTEVHNMVWGPESYLTEFFKTDQVPVGPNPSNQFSPGFIYGSEEPVGGVWTYTGSNYGNGFFWSPLMDDQPGNPPNGLPGVEQITFDTPGTYSYFCAIHGPEMKGTIIVQ